jgi:allophanate hydrolase
VTVSDNRASPTEAVASAYQRLRVGQPEAWITVVPEDEALGRAHRLEVEGRRDRPLWGQPFAVKDNIDVAGLPTTAACPAFAYTATGTAPAVQLLLDAGAVLVGKTNLDQFATGLVGTRSPYGACHSVLDAARVAGGSSSGSAVAVAEGAVRFALGTDTAGSGRVPAAANGIVGLKPSRDLVSIDGVVPACRSIDCVSVFARSVGDARRVVEVLAGPAQLVPSDKLTVGVPTSDQWTISADEEVAYRQSLARVAGFADVHEVDLSHYLEAGSMLYQSALVAERLTTIGPLLAEAPDAVHPVVREVVSKGIAATAVDLHVAQHRLADLQREFMSVWGTVDALVLPTIPDVPTLAAVEADPIGSNARLGRWTQGTNLLNLCAAAVPSGRRPDGLPGSVTVLGPWGADLLVSWLAARITGEPAGPCP